MKSAIPSSKRGSMARRDNTNAYSRHKRKPFQYPPDWAGWLDLTDTRVVQIVGLGKKPENGPDVVLYWTSRLAYKANLAIDLTRMTEPELDEFKNFLNETIELARP